MVGHEILSDNWWKFPVLVSHEAEETVVSVIQS